MKNPILIAILGIAVAGISFGLVSPVTVILLEKNSTPSWVTGSVTTMLYISVVLFSSLTGKLIIKYKLKRILSTGLLLTFFCSLGLIYWRSYFILFAVRFLLGIGVTFLFVATEVLINSYSNDKNRSRNISLYVMFLSLGIAIGTLLIWTVNIYEWLPFVIGSSMVLLVFILESLMLTNLDQVADSESVPERFPVRLMPLIALASAALYGIFESSIGVVIPLFGLRNGFTENEVAYFMAAYVIGGIVLLYFIGLQSDKRAKYKLILVLSLMLAVFILMPGLFSGPVLLIIIFFIVGGIVPAFYTVGLTYTVEKVDKKFIAQANGHFAMFYGLGTLLGPIAGSMLVEVNKRYGYWSVTMLLCLVFFLYFAFIRKENSKKS